MIRLWHELAVCWPVQLLSRAASCQKSDASPYTIATREDSKLKDSVHMLKIVRKLKRVASLFVSKGHQKDPPQVTPTSQPPIQTTKLDKVPLFWPPQKTSEQRPQKAQAMGPWRARPPCGPCGRSFWPSSGPSGRARRPGAETATTPPRRALVCGRSRHPEKPPANGGVTAHQVYG